jgi:mannosylglycerate hydrolase
VSRSARDPDDGRLPTSPLSVPRRIAVVPHTHWDREWYDPFQTFRLKLVRMIDGLLDLLEHDPAYRHFLLDGQMAVVDDYLEIRPEHEGRLRALVTAGRLSVGPWYILMDEFLVSGETIVRNLQAGIRRGSAFGGVMEVGYLPDMFGHVAQMPQILSLAGLDHAVVWRGVPSAVDATAFVWKAPDGSEVRAEYLVAGYGNGAAVPDDAKALVRRITAHVDEIGDYLPDGAPLLFMNGTDHQRPQPWLGRVVAEANQLQDDFELDIGSLPDYLDTVTSDGLQCWDGELRSGFRSNLLMGVGSNRIDVKQAAARTERTLERIAEPLSALYLDPCDWPAPFLDVAWRQVIRNAAHDSICACSADEVVDAVLSRYGEARHIGEGLVGEALRAIGSSMKDPGTVVVNPTAHDRGGMVEVVLPMDGDPGPDIQVLYEPSGLPGTLTLDGSTVKHMLGLLQGARINDDTYITDVSWDEDESGLDVSIVIGTEPRDGVPIEEIKRELFTRLSADPDTEVRLSIDQPAARRVLARQQCVSGFGWSTLAPSKLDHPVTVKPAEGVGASAILLGNGLVSVIADPIDGTFSINGVPGYGALVDGGDHGDTYNYSPPVDDLVVDSPDAVSISIGDTGPVRATVVITSTFTWPDRVDGTLHARVGSHQVDVATTIEIRADEPIVRVHTAFDNPSRDHRLRVHLPLPVPSAHSHAECAFTVVTRGLTAEGRADEFATPTFPSRRFVSCGGLTVVHEGLPEYELIDIDIADGGEGRIPVAATLALTLLRATGMLSRLGMTTRPFPAGPMTPLEGPQMIGPVEARYALCVESCDPYRLADQVLIPLMTTGSFGGGTRPLSGTPLSIQGAEVSAVQIRDGAIEVRVLNPSDRPAMIDVEGRSGWLVDLRGRPLVPFERRFELRGHGIATFRLD